jgi:hypothetical protein
MTGDIATVIATRSDLKAVGIDYDITDMSGAVIQYYRTQYIQIAINFEIDDMKLNLTFDLPKSYVTISTKDALDYTEQQVINEV